MKSNKHNVIIDTMKEKKREKNGPKIKKGTNS